MDIDLRLLRSFVVIFEQGSLVRAADRLHCTAAALSARLKSLEGEIGAPLFDRRPTGLEPNARGAEVYARALGVLSVYDEMMSATRSRPVRTKVRIGLPDDYAMAWLPAALRGLGDRFDRAEFEIVCDLSASLMARVQRQELDLALVTVAARPALARAGGMLPLRWIGDGAQTVAIAAYPEGCVFRRAMIAALDQAGRPWRIAVQSASQAGIFGAVRAGRAVSVVAKGTAPEGFIEHVETAFLPSMPQVPVFLVGRDQPAAEVGAFETSLLDSLPWLKRLQGPGATPWEPRSGASA